MDKDRLAGGQPAALEQVRPDGEIGFGQAGGGDEIETLGDRQALAGGRDAIFGVAGADDERADSVARLPPAAAGHHLTGDFEAHDRRRAGRHRVAAEPLEDVGPVDAGGVDPDQHLAGAGRRHRARDRHQHLGAAGGGGVDGGHRRWDSHRCGIDSGCAPVNLGGMEDDLPRPKNDILAALVAEDLDRLSLVELEERIAVLDAESARTRAKREGATAFRSAADALFRR